MVMNFLIRMVVPMRREFGRSLDVQQFMRDQGYAQTVLDEALGSRDERLREYAQRVQQHLFGPRAATSPAAAQSLPAVHAPVPAPAPDAAAAVAATAAAPAASPATEGEAYEAELRAKMLRRYTSGLR
jgi:hypothetical protein